MLRTYRANVAGPSHREAGIPCQDSCAVERIGERLVVTAVADGLGSERHSDIGSRVACSTAVSHCAETLAETWAARDGKGLSAQEASDGSDTDRGAMNEEAPDASGDVIAVIREAFACAYEAVLDEAARRGQPAGQFDSTLCLAVFDGETVWWGHSGDSGLVVALKDGRYVLVTRMQRDREGHVYPLCFDERWEFGSVDGVATLMLCTDGVLEAIVAPPVLAAHADNPVDTRLARMFLHPEPDDAEHLAEVEEQAARYLDTYPRKLLDDDKTVVVAFDDTALPAEQPDPYYAGPDWIAVLAKAQANLYSERPPQPGTDELERP